MALDANVLTNLVPKILARSLLVLRARCIMPRLVNSDYSTDAARKGATIDVPIPVEVATMNVVPSCTQAECDDSGLEPGLVSIKLDNWKQNKPIHLTDKDMAEIDMNETYLPMQLEEAIKGLARDVNMDIMQEYLGVYGFQGTAGTTPFGTGVGVSDATGARKILNKQHCPPTDRRGVLDFDAEANALDLSAFSDADKIMSATVKLEGEIGRKYGIDWVADDDVPYHTAGTLETGGQVTVTAVKAASTIALTGAAGNSGETLLVGDILKFGAAGIDDQTYVVMPGSEGVSGYAALTGTNGGYTMDAEGDNLTAVVVAPAIKVAHTGAALELKASHRVNLVFHRDAFAFATRSLDDANTLAKVLGGSQILSMQDAKTGLVLRLEISRRNKLTVWEFDILWGAKLVRPELACRLVG